MNVKNTEIRTYYTEKNGLVGLNSNSGGKWINQNFLIKSIRILVEV